MFLSVGLADGTALRAPWPQNTWDIILPLLPQNSFLYKILKLKVSVSSGLIFPEGNQRSKRFTYRSL